MTLVQENVDLSGFTTYRLPGRAAYLAVVHTVSELQEAWSFAQARALPVAVIGSGSNVIVRQREYAGLLVVNSISSLARLGGDRVEVGAGTVLQDLIEFCSWEGLQGVARLAGIPGTVGGAIFGNAGAFGEQVGDVIVEVTHLDQAGALVRVSREGCRFAYRTSAFKRGEVPGIIVSAVLQLRGDDPHTVGRLVEDTLVARKGKHPVGCSCGSFFKNIEVDRLPAEVAAGVRQWAVYGRLPAGRLIQEAGGKGLRVGGAYVSERHGNFLINDGSATAADLTELAGLLKARVRTRFGIELEEEVRYL